MRSYQDALDLFSARRKRGTLNRGVKLANNTYLVWSDREPGTDPKWFAVRLHDTNIVTYHWDGRIVLDSGGWDTVTTKRRMNDYTPPRWSFYQKAYLWFLVDHEKGWENAPTVHYEDGMILAPDGSVNPPGDFR